MSKESEQIARIQAGLGCAYDEAREVYLSDVAIDHGEKQEFDLPPDKIKVAQKFARTGTRKMKETGLRLTKRERKPNATKAGIVAEIAQFLTEKSEFSTENVEITNKERQIAFKIGEDSFELTLVQKRKPKK